MNMIVPAGKNVRFHTVLYREAESDIFTQAQYRWSRIFLWLSLFSLFASISAAANFTCHDPKIVAAAEAARIRSAIFWTGKPLPGTWYLPCPINVTHGNHSGGGATRFRFENGQVHSWSMSVKGPQTALLNDVIPHEVDHAVRASLVRHPIERWLDEGCATLFESPEVQRQLRLVANQTEGAIIQTDWLNNDEYPLAAAEIERLYAVGFSLVEYLLSQQDAATLLEFQQQSGSVEKRLEHNYGLTLADFRNGWKVWKQHRSQPQTVLKCECPHSSKPLLVIWTAKWCGGCQAFRKLWIEDADFREALQETFHIHILDYDQHRRLARVHGIQNLPTFQTQRQRVIGFENRESLFAKLSVPQNKVNFETPEGIPAQTVPLITDENASERNKTNVASNEIPKEPPTQTQEENGSVSVVSIPPLQSTGWFARIINALPAGLTLLQWGGIVGGSAATGGLVGVAIAVIPKLLFLRKRRRTQSASNDTAPGAGSVTLPDYPFPRELDEASQLLKIRQSEGRVAVLDALRGMFLDDEIEKLKTIQNPSTSAVLDELLSTIDQRVDDIAPLSTSYPSPLKVVES